ncbi:hypothetical protein [Frankia sp. AgB32]|uniref:hypothetical protein n=1 Tax=Frankia sp. AgB32 TaxID=631119 RepID=UPI00200E5E65|nr:hypothetical protein [Frankia sp. AgB32]MCK9894571.1 hypothetical protein [Frankia sp. AgB32]
MRFIVDEEALSCAGLTGWGDVEGEIIAFVELLADIRGSGETVGILRGWGAVAFVFGADVGSALAISPRIDRDVRVLLMRLLDKCVDWDADPAIAVDGDVHVDDTASYSLGLARAVQLAADGGNAGVLSLPWRELAGLRRVTAQHLQAEIMILDRAADVPLFYRALIGWEATDERHFFSLAEKAFPGLCFAPKLSFRKFAGGYDVRDTVVLHLGALNDYFLKHFVAERGSSAEISARLGIDVSIEGKTRGSAALMRKRDVEYEGFLFR